MGFLDESLLRVISEPEELRRSKFTGGGNRENTFSWVRVPQPPRRIPSHQWGPAARPPRALGSATPDSQGHLIAGSGTSFNSSLTFFFLKQRLLSL